MHLQPCWPVIYHWNISFVQRPTCSWRVTTHVGKPSAAGQPTRSTQPFILSGSINECIDFSCYFRRAQCQGRLARAWVGGRPALVKHHWLSCVTDVGRALWLSYIKDYYYYYYYYYQLINWFIHSFTLIPSIKHTHTYYIYFSLK